MSMKSLARTPQKELEYGAVDVPAIYYPSFYVDSTQMAEIDEWEVGEEYTITVKVKMTSYSLQESEKRDSTSSASFDILEYGTKAQKSLS